MAYLVELFICAYLLCMLLTSIGFRVRKFLGTYLLVVYLTFIILQDRILVCVCVCVFFSCGATTKLGPRPPCS